MSTVPQSAVHSAQRIVIKVGSSLVTNNGKGLDNTAIRQWASQIAALRKQNKQVVLVSSGSVAEGMARLNWQTRPKAMNELQAAAAIGQMGLIQAYETAFHEHNLCAAQILLTHEDLADRHRYLNARSTLFTLLDLGVIPIVNENDTVVTDEIRLGDNDTLGALVTNLIEADVLIILTDQSGLYDSDPRKNPQAKLISVATAGDPALEEMAGGAGSNIGTGGMATKVLAAKRAANSGAHTVIASGREPNVLERLSQGESIGSELRASVAVRSARKQWLADHLRLRGQITLDEGALKALTLQGKSLLPVGVIRVNGEFERGDVVACMDENNVEYARGLINYSSSDTRRIMRQPTHKIETILGSMTAAELMHRNNMVVLRKFAKA
ncbi:glutamate 5-kinase [Advenella alkanexedens]|jgi:glutamate 5-kinase|uniref:Glutamate 5-kinase n=1 Tax=Advenella alkanexedens TaxID=1481665 RepID=A0ABS6NL92_9BURK|nr:MULTISPECIES: glutamate 5-kinase [Advenella]MBV4396403.1 glutamate 5-kinase [Advenella alkanexedens]MDD3757591.1 glutamate 5-kinase [Advenella sp.]NLN68671.1 glutamate 5-kinase [Alcaligenaceae bacterium]